MASAPQDPRPAKEKLKPIAAHIRPERDTDAAAIAHVIGDAFRADDEISLVDALRVDDSLALSLVAEIEDGDGRTLIGHIAFSPIRAPWPPFLRGMALAPLAVSREHQRRGVGKQLVEAGLNWCRDEGIAAVVVLGDPGYYEKFGFISSEDYRLTCPWPVPPGAFQVLELKAGMIPKFGGKVRYAKPFDVF